MFVLLKVLPLGPIEVFDRPLKSRSRPNFENVLSFLFSFVFTRGIVNLFSLLGPLSNNDRNVANNNCTND